ncbi:hypothetical protein ACROYT_G027398 [Oculina patagonica]
MKLIRGSVITSQNSAVSEFQKSEFEQRFGLAVPVSGHQVGMLDVDLGWVKYSKNDECGGKRCITAVLFWIDDLRKMVGILDVDIHGSEVFHERWL